MVRIRIIYCANNPLTRIDPSGKFIWFAPLILYAPVILASLAMLVNTPVLQANLADNINTASSRNASSVDKMIAIGSIGADLTPAGGGSRIAKNAVKGRALEKTASKFLGIAKNTRKTVINGNTRIVDFIGKDKIYEAKNVKYQALTRQIKDFIQIANRDGKQATLIVNDVTKLSGRLKQLVNEGIVEVIKIKMN